MALSLMGLATGESPGAPGGPEEGGSGLFSTALLIYPPTSAQGPAGGSHVRGAEPKSRLIPPDRRGGEPPQGLDPRSGAL
jgi:hypothetical protein